MRRPSKKSYELIGKSDPLKYVGQRGGNCPKRNLRESINEDSRKPNGRWSEAGWQPTLAQRVTGGKVC